MFKNKIAYAVILMLCSLNIYALTIDEFTQLDELRLKNFTEFRSRIKSLEPENINYESETHNYYSLLKAYEAVMLTDYAESLKFALPVTYYPHDLSLSFRAKALVANTLIHSRDYSRAFTYLEEMINQLDNVPDKRAKNHGLNVISFMYNRVDKYELAYYYSNIIYGNTDSGAEKCHSSFNKIEALIGLNKSEIEFEIKNALAFCEEADEPLFGWLIKSLRLEHLVKQGLFQAAVANYEGMMLQKGILDYPIVKTRIYHQALHAYLGISDVASAEILAKQIVDESKSELISKPVMSSYKVLLEIYREKGQFEQALNYYELYNKAQNAYQDDRSARLLAYNLALGEIEVKNQRISLLDKDNELLSLQRNIYQQEVRQNRLIMLLLFSVLVIASFTAYRGMSGRKRFKKIAEYDQLTGISNRYHFNNLAKVALDYCELNAKPAALILFDLDYFKTINDNYGHATGDWALQQVVKTCRNFMRNNDVFGRIGGEEFAVVLPGCYADKAALLAEICRDAIATIDTTESGYQFPLSASFGVSSSDISGYQLKQLLADADLAMYRAKQSGRDQIATYTHLMDKTD
ncbi:diguanylate cyclase (GGDEF)-like protein [Rheinheimera pacifica]|uniref:GGDEF domain-containing protein n=1 Tax=Rheinheimera pacifica TaxID=173990 RepID=UPI0028643F96|nr:GGDEF domain-containing protein [Rheinheimera pacifica]MDR6982781.1 diguanylate cyclase (GGDEF)-like protein [Rheinheimera pacifica]